MGSERIERKREAEKSWRNFASLKSRSLLSFSLLLSLLSLSVLSPLFSHSSVCLFLYFSFFSAYPLSLSLPSLFIHSLFPFSYLPSLFSSFFSYSLFPLSSPLFSRLTLSFPLSLFSLSFFFSLLSLFFPLSLLSLSPLPHLCPLPSFPFLFSFSLLFLSSPLSLSPRFATSSRVLVVFFRVSNWIW